MQRNNEASSGNHCCCGKSISITYFCVCMWAWVSECVWVHERERVLSRV